MTTKTNNFIKRLSGSFILLLIMSLFPAYSNEDNIQNTAEQPTTSKETSNKWLENNSFAIKPQDLQQLQEKEAKSTEQTESTDSDSPSSGNKEDNSSDASQEDNSSDASQEDNNRKHKKRQKLSKKPRKEKQILIVEPTLDFTGQEEFYVDKNRAKQYNTIRTLHKPACPRYRSYYHTLGRNFYGKEKYKPKRYYKYKEDTFASENSLNQVYPLPENEYTLKMGELNRKTMDQAEDIQNWLDLIELQNRNPYKWSRLRVAEKKIDYVLKAFNYHPGNEELYKVYITTITQSYTSHDVGKMLETLLQKDPHNLTLWQALIMCTQGTMARCTVPEVLQIYERCMKKMFHNQKQALTSQVTDTVMIRLFYNCSLFLRQSGLYEQFFALIKLALELNVAVNAKLLEDLQPQPEDDQTLIEYEELILQSGLPMNEIWLRIEKLRQGFNFLPYPGNNDKCSDPQRIVFNEDVCHYVYPLKSQEYTFKLLLIILKLLKFPFISTHGMFLQFEGDTDAIEDLLAVLLNHHYIYSTDQEEFFESLYELTKEMVNTPTFLSSCIAHELYSNCLKKFLLNCSLAFEQIDERKRLIFLLQWCRFERLLLKLEKLNKKLTTEFIQKGRKRFKSLLKLPKNRNALLLYVEFGLYEFEAEAGQQNIENIFVNFIEAYNKEDNLKSEMAYVYLIYAEILLKWQNIEKLSQLLTIYGLGLDISQINDITNPRKLLALKSIRENLDKTIKIEQNVEILIAEQQFLPDYTLTQLNIYCLLAYSLQQKQQILEYLQKLLEIFKSSTNERHLYLREHIYELYINILQLPKGNSYISHSLLQLAIYKGLQDYPHNLFLLQKWGCLQSMPWYKLRGGYLKLNPSIKSVIYLIALARCRFIKTLSSGNSVEAQYFNSIAPNDLQYHELFVRQRILNLFKVLIPSEANSTSFSSSSSSSSLSIYSSLQRNSLFWRCYLRCLSDQNCSFDLSKKCLLMALDECPWSKALYLDGATYIPQELSHLQDLIIEKQLRIYALPEELEILRER